MTEGAAVAADGRLREVERAACRPANRVVHATVADQANRCAGTADLRGWMPPLPPIAVPDTVTVPPVAELPKTAGPSPPLDKVAEPPLPPARPEHCGTSGPACCGRGDRDLLASDTACLGVCATSIAAQAQLL